MNAHQSFICTLRDNTSVSLNCFYELGVLFKENGYVLLTTLFQIGLTLDNAQGDVLWFLKVLKVSLKFYFICLSLGRGTSRGHLARISRFHYNHLNPASCYHTGCFDCIVPHFYSPASQQQDKRYLLLSSILNNIWFPKLWFNRRTKWCFWKYGKK